MDELKTMRTFVKVVDEGSFAGAARALNVANSVVTRAVAELEESLKARLLNRTTRALSLTEIGMQYLERVRTILEDIDEANNQATEANGNLRGVVRVAAPQEFLVSSLARLVPRFSERHPDLNVQLEVCSQDARSPDDAADVTILVHGPDPLDGNFVARLLAHAEAVLCATPEYLRRHPPILKPADLEEHTMLMPEAAFDRKVWLFHSDAGDAPRETASLQPRRAPIGSHNAASLLSVARGHFGIAGALSVSVADDLRAGRLQRVLPDWYVASFRIYAAVPSRSHMPRRTRAFIEFLVEQYGGQASDPWLSGQGG
jgi:DNA-binding transcriptional LysR family regulator